MATITGQEIIWSNTQGYIRYNHIGEGDYAQTEQMIQSLLDEGVIT